MTTTKQYCRVDTNRRSYTFYKQQTDGTEAAIPALDDSTLAMKDLIPVGEQLKRVTSWTDGDGGTSLVRIKKGGDTLFSIGGGGASKGIGTSVGATTPGLPHGEDIIPPIPMKSDLTLLGTTEDEKDAT